MIRSRRPPTSSVILKNRPRSFSFKSRKKVFLSIWTFSERSVLSSPRCSIFFSPFSLKILRPSAPQLNRNFWLSVLTRRRIHHLDRSGNVAVFLYFFQHGPAAQDYQDQSPAKKHHPQFQHTGLGHSGPVLPTASQTKNEFQPLHAGYLTMSLPLFHDPVRDIFLTKFSTPQSPPRPYIFKKLASRSLPSLLKIDSGWNCTPWTGKSRCRNPMISPSAVSAVTSKQAGTEFFSTSNE